jgi:hypothetical protein
MSTCFYKRLLHKITLSKARQHLLNRKMTKLDAAHDRYDIRSELTRLVASILFKTFRLTN